MFRVDRINDHYRLKYFDEELDIYIYICKKTSNEIDNEIKNIGITSKLPIALLPKDLIENDLQLILGPIYYHLYREKFSKVKNKGLLLSMFILGYTQLKDLIDDVKKYYRLSEQYFITTIEHGLKLDNCRPYIIENMKETSYDAVVKKLYRIITRI